MKHGPTNTRVFAQAIRAAAVQNDYKRLRDLAEKLWTLAEAGEAWAIQMIADRIDGKALQSLELDVEHSGSVAVEHRGLPATAQWLGEVLGSGQETALPESRPH